MSLSTSTANPATAPKAPPPKSWTPDPDDAEGLSRRARRAFKLALKVRRDETPRGQAPPASIRITMRWVAELWDVNPGNALRAFHALKAEYPDIDFVRVGHAWEVRFGYNLLGAHSSAPTAEVPARSAGKTAAPSAGKRPRSARESGAVSTEFPRQAPDVPAPCADSLPLCSNLDELDEEQRTLTPAEPEPERSAAPPPDGGTGTAEAAPIAAGTPDETPEERAARVDAHLNAMPAEERDRIVAAVKAANPGVHKFEAMFRPLVRAAVEKADRVRFPELPDAVGKATAATPATTARPPVADTEARRLLRIGEPTGPESVKEAVKGLVKLTGGVHMRPFFKGVLRDVLPRADLVDELAEAIDTAVKAPMPPHIKSRNHFVTVSVMGFLRDEGLRPPARPRGRATP